MPGVPVRSRSRARRFSIPVATMVSGIRNSIRAVGSETSPVTANARVMECPIVNAVITHSMFRASRNR